MKPSLPGTSRRPAGKPHRNVTGTPVTNFSDGQAWSSLPSAQFPPVGAACQPPQKPAMNERFRKLTLSLASTHHPERRWDPRNRTEPLPALLTDLYRERVPVSVLNVSHSGLGIKVSERFATDLPVLIECEGLAIVGNVRHCLRAADGGYVVGMKIYQIVDIMEARAESEKPDIAKGAGRLC